MAATRSIRTTPTGGATATKIVKRSKVLTTAMAEDALPADTPLVKKRCVKIAVVKKRPTKTVKRKATAPAATPIDVAPVAVLCDAEPVVTIDDGPESASIWNDAREPRPPRRSAVDRLDDPPPADGALLVARVAQAIERELTQIERIVGNNRVPPRERTEAERRARTLASLARTLSLVTQLREKNLPRPDDDDNTAPRDLDELRETLARRLECLVAEQSQRVHREPDTS